MVIKQCKPVCQLLFLKLLGVSVFYDENDAENYAQFLIIIFNYYCTITY